MLSAGTKAPDFSLPDQNGKIKSLSYFKRQRILLYFYPKDMTSGCSEQACAFGKLYSQFREKDVFIIGISNDSVATHNKFEEKYGLPFTMLSDTEKQLSKATIYGKRRKTRYDLIGVHKRCDIIMKNIPFILKTPNDDEGYKPEIHTVTNWFK